MARHGPQSDTSGLLDLAPGTDTLGWLSHKIEPCITILECNMSVRSCVVVINDVTSLDYWNPCIVLGFYQSLLTIKNLLGTVVHWVCDCGLKLIKCPM